MKASRRLRARIQHLAERIDLPIYQVIGFEYSDSANPWISRDFGGRYHYMSNERGKTLFDRTTRNRDELLFWVFVRATSESAWARAPRSDDGPEHTTAVLALQMHLLHTLNPAWARRWRTEVNLSRYQEGARLPDPID